MTRVQVCVGKTHRSSACARDQDLQEQTHRICRLALLQSRQPPQIPLGASAPGALAISPQRESFIVSTSAAPFFRRRSAFSRDAPANSAHILWWEREGGDSRCRSREERAASPLPPPSLWFFASVACDVLCTLSFCKLRECDSGPEPTVRQEISVNWPRRSPFGVSRLVTQARGSGPPADGETLRRTRLATTTAQRQRRRRRRQRIAHARAI